ncbi:MAG TPA: tetratricopeptide repeat protein [Gemmataceae bacterium]|nr:tetratricopeptide repeat protein [Gemmataceae bacterium]
MGTISPPTDSDAPGAGAARQLWQVPVFVAGAVALLGALLARPLVCGGPGRQLDHDLAAARALVGRPDGDAEEALRLARRAVDAARQAPGRAGEALFLLGCAHVRLAERKAAPGPDEHWRNARQSLEEATREGVPPEDAARLSYQLGKAGFHTGDAPEVVAGRLAAGVEEAENRVEALDLLTRAYLRLSPPDLRKALEANEQLRQVPLAGEEVLAPARLTAGELYLQLGKPERARQVLEKVGEQAPPAVLARARLLRAQSFEDEGKWAQAAPLYGAALADAREPLPAPGTVLYHLGLCYQRLEQPPEAADAWEKCVRGKGPAARAAAVALAELRVQEGQPEKGVELLAGAVEGLKGPQAWANPLLDLARAREAFERVADALRGDGRFELAVRLARSYEKLAAPPRAQVLRAEASAAWARWRHEAAARAKTNEAQQAEELASRALLAQAGAAYGEAAGLAKDAAAQGECLWQSAGQYLAGQEYDRAVEQLSSFLQRQPRSPRQGEGWYLLGEAHGELGHAAAAMAAYRESIKFPGRFAYQARYRLALAALAAGNLDEAEAALAQNLVALRIDPDAEAEEKSLFALGGLLYKRGNYRMVVRRLEEALGRFAAEAGPHDRLTANPEYTRARYQLADSYCQLANQVTQSLFVDRTIAAETRQHFEEEKRGWLEKALRELDRLAADLGRPEVQGHLSAGQRLQLPFTAARCCFNLGDYDGALRRYEQLSARYQREPAGLDALAGEVHCYAGMRLADRVRDRLEAVGRLVPHVQGLEAAEREKWLNWVRDATRALDQQPEQRAPAGGPDVGH